MTAMDIDHSGYHTTKFRMQLY